MKIKKAMLIAVLAVAIAALAVPLVGFSARAAGAEANAPALRATKAKAVAASLATSPGLQEVQREAAAPETEGVGKISAETKSALGIRRLPKNQLAAARTKAVQKITAGAANTITPLPPGGRFDAPTGAGNFLTGPPLFGQPNVLNVNDALSAALITTIGGRDTQFSEVALIADWDGREDCAADRGVKIDDFSGVESDIDFSLTRAAISEHTRGNGHPFFNVYYYGDSVGNVYLGLDVTGTPLVDVIFSINFPELVNTGSSNGFNLLNPTAGDCTDDQVTVTGIAVNPVADLGDFNPDLCGVVGEVVYISVLDTEGCASNSSGNPIRTRIFAFGAFEGSDAGGGFIAFTNVRQILRSKFANTAGIAVDDDGSLYYQLASFP